MSHNISCISSSDECVFSFRSKEGQPLERGGSGGTWKVSVGRPVEEIEGKLAGRPIQCEFNKYSGGVRIRGLAGTFYLCSWSATLASPSSEARCYIEFDEWPGYVFYPSKADPITSTFGGSGVFYARSCRAFELRVMADADMGQKTVLSWDIRVRSLNFGPLTRSHTVLHDWRS
jgi:hypothetical protein